jgi:hypothetical protein
LDPIEPVTSESFDIAVQPPRLAATIATSEADATSRAGLNL